MFKRNIFLLTLFIAVMISACSNNGKQAVTADAKEVATVKTNATTTYNSVKSGSTVLWRASHLGGVQPRSGQVSIKNATFSATGSKLTNATVTIDMASLTVESFPEGAAEKGKLTGHLQSGDFFNVEKYPTAKFELTNLQNTTGEYNSKVTGNLTILDVTKSISFNANVDASDSQVAIKSEDFSIDRTDWGLTYNIEGTAGVPVDYLIAKDIGFTINTTVTK